MVPDLTSAIERAAEELRSRPRICCLTGAGISAESGVPTFRGAGGVWNGRRAEELATPQGFARDPAGVWAFYHHRLEVLGNCRPNAGHRALVELERQRPGFSLVTQNVDGLHRRAGSRRMIELHGNIWTARCSACAQEFAAESIKTSKVPHCRDCGALLRPGVVWFGEMLPEAGLQAAYQAAESCQAMLVVGTSSVVQPAASLAAVAADRGGWVVEINLEPTPLSPRADACLHGRSGTILPELVRRLCRGG